LLISNLPLQVQYDTLVVAVGEQPASFGVPGVREHCFFMKEITDCVELRSRIGTLFELCNLPGTPEEDRCDPLSLVADCKHAHGP
jgi:NADH:ubiquinone reductase (non-electrogenic)